MEQELYWIYAFNVIVNSSLSFFTTLFLVELLIRLLRIKQPRIKATCYLIPFCKLCIDPFLYHFSNWALLYGINPAFAETGTRQLSITVSTFTQIQLSMEDGKTFSVADLMALCSNIFFVQAIVSIALTGTIFACIRWMARIFRSQRCAHQIVQNSTSIDWPTLNTRLSDWMKQTGVQCASTSAVDSPCIVKKKILFPVKLLQHLTQEEVEAIIAHEMAHFCWCDCSLRLGFSLIAHVFWWIPTRWWQRRTSEMQEQASDNMIHRFGISRFALAEAVLKTAQNTRMPSELSCSFVERRIFLNKRMKMILQKPREQALPWKVIQYGLLGISLLSILLGRSWIF